MSCGKPQNLIPRKAAIKFWTGLSAILACLLLLLLNQDEKPEPPLDLKPLGDRSRNGFLWLANEWEKVPLPDDRSLKRVYGMENGKRVWIQWAVDLLKLEDGKWENDMSIALAMPEWQMQPWPPGRSSSFSPIRVISSRFFLMSVLATDRFRHGQSKQAMALLEQMSKISKRSAQGAASFQDGVGAFGMAGYVIEVAANAGQFPEIPNQILAQLQDTLEACEFDRKDFLNITRHQAVLIGNAVRVDSAKLSPWRRLFYKPVQTDNLIIRIQRELELSHLEPRQGVQDIRESALYQLLPDPGKFHWLDFNRSGRKILRTYRQKMENSDLDFRQHIAKSRMTMASLAVKRWQNDHSQQMPKSLDVLVPDYVRAVPADPFDGKPLRWDRSEGYLYVLGADWIDDAPRKNYHSSGHFIDYSEIPSLRLIETDSSQELGK